MSSGTFKVSSGTGSYQGYTDSGTFKVTFSGKFAEKNGVCPSESALENANPVSALTVFKVQGDRQADVVSKPGVPPLIPVTICAPRSVHIGFALDDAAPMFEITLSELAEDVGLVYLPGT